MTNDKTPNKKVAIIGTGIAGLSAAFLLSSKRGDSQYDVTLFEREAELGMDAHALNIREDGKCENGKPKSTLKRINTPPRAFSKGYYPNLIELYRVAGVEVCKWSWAYNYSVAGDEHPYIRVGDTRILGYRVPQFSRLSQWLKLLRPQNLSMIKDFFRFHFHISRDMWDEHISATMTLREYCTFRGLSDVFLYQGLLPILSMICTCSYQACLDYPVDVIMHYYYSNSTHGQYRTKYGTRDAVTKLSANVSEILTNAKVLKVWKQNSKATKNKVAYLNESEKEIVLEFDLVIMATQANHALEMVQDLDNSERNILESVEHEKSLVVIHRDPIVMPKYKEDWNPMNAMTSRAHDASMFTIWMNDSYKELADNMFQTWNPIVDIKDELVYKRIYFERPLVTKKSLKAVADMKEANGMHGIWYCSAWNAHRIPLQESGVVSALEVYRSITGENPEGGFTDAHNHFNVIKHSLSMQEENSANGISVDKELSSTSGSLKALATLTVGVAVLSYIARITRSL